MDYITIRRRALRLLRVELTYPESDLFDEDPINSERYIRDFNNSRVELLREIETLDKPLSTHLKAEFISEIESSRQRLQLRKVELHNETRFDLDFTFDCQLRFCSELLSALEQSNTLTSAENKVKLPFQTSQVELAIILYGILEAKLIPVKQEELLDFFSNNFKYYNTREMEYKDINRQTLYKELSDAKAGFRRDFKRGNPIDSAGEKLKIILDHIEKIRSLETK